jgi:hypothetical protein
LLVNLERRRRVRDEERSTGFLLSALPLRFWKPRVVDVLAIIWPKDLRSMVGSMVGAFEARLLLARGYVSLTDSQRAIEIFDSSVDFHQ